MKYFYDCEFLEGAQTKKVFGIPFGKTLNTIDLISIGVVANGARELYLISKEFNLKEAWNRFQMKQVYGDARNIFPEGVKEYWIRENVLKPIFEHFIKCEKAGSWKMEQICGYGWNVNTSFTYRNFKRLLKKYGLARKTIRWELTKFLLDPNDEVWNDWLGSSDHYWNVITKQHHITAELYGYYSAYDHVCLSWIYGKMIDLPDGIPMYTTDLKQIMDEKVKQHLDRWGFADFEKGLKKLKSHDHYPTQDNCHDALDDAKWNNRLFEFLKTLK